MRQPHRWCPLTATARPHTPVAVATRAPPRLALLQPQVSSPTPTAHGRLASHLHRRDALRDPLHCLVLAAVVSCVLRTGRCHGRGVGQDPWRRAWGEHISPHSSVLAGRRLDWAAKMANSSASGASGSSSDALYKELWHA